MSEPRLDPVALSVMGHVLAGIAEEMGAVLVRAAYSSNIKERRDCSTAIFNDAGIMVAQAEHIPVHLGAMPEAVEAVRRRDPQAGDVFIVNDPYAGGTHLPDITLISPVHVRGERIGYAVTRAHHSDVGGARPGSMPADSREIYQEGIVVPPVRLVEAGRQRAGVMELLLANSRTPELRRGDLQAQLAANRLAERRLEEVVARRGRETVVAAFDEVVAYTERMARAAIRELPDGVFASETEVEGDGVTEDDIPIRTSVAIDGDRVTIDFTGTSGAVPGNVNCPLAVTRSACSFALRVLLPMDLPTNAGAFAPMEIRAPSGCLVNAASPSAVVAGNVETSQRIADAVLRAFAKVAELPAEGQGTMNNLVIGGRGWTYYETLGGGQGASARGPGASGVHVGMTNTLNTPIEALELEAPMRVERYELVDGTGGRGAHPGGDGLVRSIRLLEPATISLLTDRRRHSPRGARGGGAGAVGRNLVDGVDVGPKASRDLAAGAVVTVFTPGGGGWGPADDID
jgi:N-methylhydantoinase B